MAKDYEMITVVNYVDSLDEIKEKEEVVIASVEEYLKKLAA
jgi:hypothetical protein